MGEDDEGSMGKKHDARVADLTVTILREIRDEIRELRTDTNARFDEVNGRLDQTNARLDVHEKALVKLIGEVHSLNDRFDNFLTGAHRQDHDALALRVSKLEDAVFRRTG